MSTVYEFRCDDCGVIARDMIRRAPGGTSLFISSGRDQLPDLGQFLIDHEHHDLRLRHE